MIQLDVGRCGTGQLWRAESTVGSRGRLPLRRDVARLIAVGALVCLMFAAPVRAGDPIGACCSEPTGQCIETTEAICDAGGRQYQGDGTTCDPNPCTVTIGACCFPDGSCDITEFADCAALGGVFNGADSTCDDPCPILGSCCIFGDLCVIAEAQDCIDGDGTYNGDGTDCTPDPCVTTGVGDPAVAPVRFRLSGPLPNPVRGAMRYQIDLPEGAQVVARVMDVLGTVVSRPVNEVYPAGRFQVVWNPSAIDGGRLPSGIYFLDVTAGSVRATRKFIFVH